MAACVKETSLSHRFEKKDNRHKKFTIAQVFCEYWGQVTKIPHRRKFNERERKKCKSEEREAAWPHVCWEDSTCQVRSI